VFRGVEEREKVESSRAASSLVAYIPSAPSASPPSKISGRISSVRLRTLRNLLFGATFAVDFDGRKAMAVSASIAFITQAWAA
jgi:hypothetical protein